LNRELGIYDDVSNDYGVKIYQLE